MSHKRVVSYLPPVNLCYFKSYQDRTATSKSRRAPGPAGFLSIPVCYPKPSDDGASVFIGGFGFHSLPTVRRDGAFSGAGESASRGDADRDGCRPLANTAKRRRLSHHG